MSIVSWTRPPRVTTSSATMNFSPRRNRKAAAQNEAARFLLGENVSFA